MSRRTIDFRFSTARISVPSRSRAARSTERRISWPAVGRDDGVPLGDPTCRRPSGTARDVVVEERREALGRRRSGGASSRGRGVVSRSAPGCSGRTRARRRTFMRTSKVSLNGSAANTSPHTGMSALPCARIVLRPSIARITRRSGNSPPASRARRVRSGGGFANTGATKPPPLPSSLWHAAQYLTKSARSACSVSPARPAPAAAARAIATATVIRSTPVVVYLLRSFTRLPRAGSARPSNRRPYARRSARGRPPS